MVKKVFLFALSATLMLAGCSKTEVASVKDGSDVISFQTIVGSQKTKALINSQVYPIDETFGTFAYFNAAGKTFPTGAEVYIPESEVKYVPASGSTPAYWSTDTKYYWPKQGTLAFFSYSPYDELNAVTDCDVTTGITISKWDVDAKQTVDVMVADAVSGKSYNESNGGYQGVPTVFRHKLAQIVKITFKTDKTYNTNAEASAAVGDKFFYVNSVKINNVDYEGKYVSGNQVSGTKQGTWSVTNTVANRKDYTWYDDATGLAFGETGVAVASELDNAYLLLLPQSLPTAAAVADTKNIEITYTIKTCNGSNVSGPTFTSEKVQKTISFYEIHGGTADATPSWNINTRYSYTFTVGLDQIKWAPSVVDWTDDAYGLSI
jgi:hypothetical protein